MKDSFRVRVRSGQGEILPLMESPDIGGEADFQWVHVQRGTPSMRFWLPQAGLEHLVLDALMAVETRPRWLNLKSGMLVVLRGVNLNPGADPEDMVAIRLWIEPSRVITVQGRPMQALDDMTEALAKGQAPDSPGAFLAMMTRFILDRMAPVMDDLGDEGDGLEEEVLSRPKSDLRQRVGQHRRQCIQLRRHLAPMREVVTALALDQDTILGKPERSHLHESSDRLIRIVEDLDALRERAVVTHDELGALLSDQINSTMFRFSLVAAIFLPLSLLTSLLGINVGGIPGATHPWAFLIVCLALSILGGALGLLMWRRYWRRS